MSLHSWESSARCSGSTNPCEQQGLQPTPIPTFPCCFAGPSGQWHWSVLCWPERGETARVLLRWMLPPCWISALGALFKLSLLGFSMEKSCFYWKMQLPWLRTSQRFWGSRGVAEVLQRWKKPFPFPLQVQKCTGDKLPLCWVLTTSLGLGGGRAGREPKHQCLGGRRDLHYLLDTLLRLEKIMETQESQK